MPRNTNHISVCICTYKRPLLLVNLLNKVGEQETDGLFTYSIVIVDNDQSQSAEQVVAAFSRSAIIPVAYCVEPEQNIALARNRAIANAEGNLIAFIDDDEFPIRRWLVALFETYKANNVDGVLGPVNPHYDEQAPKWVIKGRFYDRPIHPSGRAVAAHEGRTGNVLLGKHVFANLSEPFRRKFRGGEDQDFFRRAIENGHVFIWCREATAYEVVPPVRCKRTFMLRRALLRGAMARLQGGCGFRSVLKSFLAVFIYAAVLPFALIVGQHKFMAVLVKLCDHLGKVLSAVGIDPIRQPYVTE